MFAEERIEEIINILNADGKILVKDLSNRFNVTEDCIRKDLKVLEKKGYIKRTYGGAVLKRRSANNYDIVNRKTVNIESKKQIAKKAFDIIENRETIFLDISTTNILLAELLAASDRKITVITNMIDIVKAFSNNNTIEVICVGGIFNNDLDGFIGSTAIENIIKYKVDKAFVGSCGVNLYEKSVTTFDVEDGNTKKAIINSSKKTYLVMDNGKFYFDGVYKFADIYDIDAIITEGSPEKNIFKILMENNIELI